MFQLRLAVELRLARRAEDLLEMAVLALIDDIEDEIGILILYAVNDGRKISCPI